MKNINSFSFTNKDNQSFKGELLGTTSILLGRTPKNVLLWPAPISYTTDYYVKNIKNIISNIGISELPIVSKKLKEDKQEFDKMKSKEIISQNTKSFKSELLGTTTLSNPIDNFRESTQNILDNNELAREIIELYKFGISENYEDIELYKLLFLEFSRLGLNVEELYRINSRICKLALSIDPTNDFFMGYLSLFGNLNDEEKTSIHDRLGVINKKA